MSFRNQTCNGITHIQSAHDRFFDVAHVGTEYADRHFNGQTVGKTF